MFFIGKRIFSKSYNVLRIWPVSVGTGPPQGLLWAHCNRVYNKEIHEIMNISNFLRRFPYETFMFVVVRIYQIDVFDINGMIIVIQKQLLF